MKHIFKILAATSLIILSANTLAQQHRHGHYQQRNHSGNNWIVPALITGAVVYGVTQYNQQPVYSPPQVYVPPQPVYIDRPIPAPTRPVYQDREYIERTLWDETCGCYQRVIVPLR